MSRRSALPGAAELFRTTGGPVDRSAPAGSDATVVPAPSRAERLLAEPQAPRSSADAQASSSATSRRSRSADSGAESSASASSTERAPTGRQRHDEKITVYVSVGELMDLERARLTLRGEHGLAVDRGRIVREALAVVLADLEAEGDASTLVRRLRSR